MTGGTGNVIVNNPGDNPLGASSATYATASIATYTAGPSRKTHYLSGGEVTAVKVLNNAGTGIRSATPRLVYLVPNVTFSVTNSVGPADVKSVH
jgi:hypothetical protein